MNAAQLSSGLAHEMPEDLARALMSDATVRELWEGLTPLARNEWICWTVSCKKPETRANHIERVVSELKEGVRRPCCWIGCIHRTDKAVSQSIKGIIGKRAS